MSAAEKHVILCSQANSVGPAACMNIERALKDPALFFFGELLGTFCHSHFPHCQHFLVGDGVFCVGGLTDSSLLHLFGTPFLPQPFPTPPLDRQLFPPLSSTSPFSSFYDPAHNTSFSPNSARPNQIIGQRQHPQKTFSVARTVCPWYVRRLQTRHVQISSFPAPLHH